MAALVSSELTSSTFRMPASRSYVPTKNVGMSVRMPPASLKKGHGLIVRATQAEAEAPATKRATRPGEHKGFVEEMRIIAMKLHTKDQAKEGQKPVQEKPMGLWKPTKEGFVQFLVDSKAVHDALEEIVEKGDEQYRRFLHTGLERSAALSQDLAWFESEGLTLPEPDKAGTAYAAYLRELAESDPPAFICHFYNVYFAHSAGGRMIGKKVSDMILEGRELEFYKWEGDLQELLTAVRQKLNEAAQEWSREQKDHCLNETEKSFKYSGEILRLLMS